LDIGILDFYNDVKGNEIAEKFIIDVAKNDLEKMKLNQQSIKKRLKALREGVNGNR
jgi:hypothetical protein